MLHCLLGIIQPLKRLNPKLIIIIIISMGFNHQALAQNASSMFVRPGAVSMVRPGAVYQDPEGYFYVGLLFEGGWASFNCLHPRFAGYWSSNFSNQCLGIAGLVGRQYLATELSFGALYSYAGVKESFFSNQLIETAFTFYTYGFGCEFIPMVPILDFLSVFLVCGIGYKGINIKLCQKEIFGSIGWKVVPRFGLGLVLYDVLRLKYLVELNNRFKYRNHNQSLLKPSALLHVTLLLNFKWSRLSTLRLG